MPRRIDPVKSAKQNEALFDEMEVPESGRKELRRYFHEVESLDDVVGITLIGHLLLEEKINEGIEHFVFHPKHLPDLTFYRKVLLARSISPFEQQDGSKGSMWDLILVINELRNALAHSLSPDKRKSKIEKVRLLLKQQQGRLSRSETKDERALILNAAGLCLGFLNSFVHGVRCFRVGADIVVEALTQYSTKQNAVDKKKRK